MCLCIKANIGKFKSRLKIKFLFFPFVTAIFTFKFIEMLEIEKKYIIDKNKKPVAVQLDIETFNKIEQLIEDYALGKLIEENSPEETLSLAEAKQFYKNLQK